MDRKHFKKFKFNSYPNFFLTQLSLNKSYENLQLTAFDNFQIIFQLEKS